MSNRFTTFAVLTLMAALGASACDKLGPQKRDEAPAQPGKEVAYAAKADLTKPEGPMYLLLQAAQERDEALFKQALAPNINTSVVDEIAFRKFRKKVLTNKVTPVPESVQMVSDTEAIVKMRNARGREIPVRVQKFDDKWLIVGIDLGDKTKGNFRERNPDAPAAPAAPAPPAAPAGGEQKSS